MTRIKKIDENQMRMAFQQKYSGSQAPNDFSTIQAGSSLMWMSSAAIWELKDVSDASQPIIERYKEFQLNKAQTALWWQ
jgi:hypothetical protein